MKDTAYLALSARLRALETTLLTPEQTETLLAAPSEDAAVRLLSSWGYPVASSSPTGADAALAAAQEALFADLTGTVPDIRFLEVFTLRTDYHNVRVLLKSAAVNVQPEHMLTGGGRVPAAELKAVMETGQWETLPGLLPEAIAEGKRVLETEHDFRLGDDLLDHWMFRDMSRTAAATGSALLRAYTARLMDAANLKSLVRLLRRGEGAAQWRPGPVSGGGVAPAAVWNVAENDGSGLSALYASTPFAQAAETGTQALNGGALTVFERQCDDAVTALFSDAWTVPFGEMPLLAYLTARETELCNLRLLLMSRGTGMETETVRAALRRICI